MNRYFKLVAGTIAFCGWLALALAGETNKTVAIHELKPGPDDAVIAHATARILEQGHYSRQPFDDTVSGKMLDLYIKMLDPQRIHFLQSDLDRFEPYRKRLDDLILRRGDTWPGYEIFTTFRERLEERTRFAEEMLKTEKFDFSKNERIQTNRKDEPAPRDLDEAKQLWRERVRFEYLQEKLARSGEKKKKESAPKPGATNGAAGTIKPQKSEAEEISELLAKRYRRVLHIYQELDRDDVFELYLTSLTRVYDPHTDYYGKSQLEQFKIAMNLALFGIGAELRIDDDGYCTIQRLMPGGPAIKCGKISEKDRIVEVAQSNGVPVDIVGMNLNKAVQLIRGPKGSEVRLTIESPETSERRIVSLVRDEIPLEEQQAKAKIVDLPGPDSKSITRVGVIDLPSFYAPMDSPGDRKNKAEPHYTSVDVARLINKMKQENVSGIVLDLRRNGGGSLEEAIRLTGLFIPEGPVVQVRGPTGDPIVDSDTDPSVLWDGPLVVLTSRYSASASEIVAAALQDYGRAVIVGDVSTHGKGTVQSLIPLAPHLQTSSLSTTNDPGALKFTIRKFYRANGGSTQFEGVTPDIVLPSLLNCSKDIGEKSLDYPLAWDTIESAQYGKLDRVAPFLAELKKASEQRIAKSKEFAYIREDIAQFLKRHEEKTISLNEKERLKEKAEEDSRQKSRNKEREARKGPEPKVYEISLKQAELPGLPPPVAKTNTLAGASSARTRAGAALSGELAESGEDEGDKPPAVDAMLNEAQFILVDYMRLLQKVVTAQK